MDILNNFFGQKNKTGEQEILPVIPREIYETGILRLQDIIAPSALEITSNHIKIGEKSGPSFVCNVIPEISGIQLVFASDKFGQSF